MVVPIPSSRRPRFGATVSAQAEHLCQWRALFTLIGSVAIIIGAWYYGSGDARAAIGQKPDLTVSSLSLELKELSLYGGLNIPGIVVNYCVKNTGDVAASGQLYLGITNSTVNSAVTKQALSVSVLQAGEERCEFWTNEGHTRNLDYFYEGFDTGYNRVVATVDPSNFITETDEENNTLQAAVSVLPLDDLALAKPYYDLKLSSLAFARVPVPGEQADFEFSFSNLSASAGAPRFQVEMTFEDTTRTIYQSDESPELRRGDRRVIGYTLPKEWITPGRHEFQLRLAPLTQDDNGDNNTLVSPLTIAAPLEAEDVAGRQPKTSAPPVKSQAPRVDQKLIGRVRGRILLQVQGKGEAWYVDPANKKRHFLGRPNDAFSIMRSQGLGVSESDIAKIPIGLQALSGGDTDGDGLSDLFEDAVVTDKNMPDTDGDGFSDREEVTSAYNPRGTGRIAVDAALVNRLKGRIVLQTQRHGEAWYVNPVDSKRYFLGRPADAFEIMRGLGLGITNTDLAMIPEVASPESLDAKRYEDIRQIQVALEIFYGMNGDRFPVVTAPVVLGEGNYSCFGQHGFAARGSAECVDPYMPVIPHNPTPGGAPYVYQAASDSYMITFRLDAGYKELSAGDYTATREDVVLKTQ
jgi:hypothetical protein